jgi:hypothetical protein
MLSSRASNARSSYRNGLQIRVEHRVVLVRRGRLEEVAGQLPGRGQEVRVLVQVEHDVEVVAVAQARVRRALGLHEHSRCRRGRRDEAELRPLVDHLAVPPVRAPSRVQRGRQRIADAAVPAPAREGGRVDRPARRVPVGEQRRGHGHVVLVDDHVVRALGRPPEVPAVGEVGLPRHGHPLGHAARRLVGRKRNGASVRLGSRRRELISMPGKNGPPTHASSAARSSAARLGHRTRSAAAVNWPSAHWASRRYCSGVTVNHVPAGRGSPCRGRRRAAA